MKVRKATGVALSRDLNHVATTPHLADTIAENLVHAKSHLDGYRRAPDELSRRFNLWHLMRHVDVTEEHVGKLARHVAAKYPRAGQALKDIAAMRSAVGLAGGIPAGSATAPGAKPIPPKNVTDYGLYQKPSQTTSPSPPLPPGVKLPTAAEIRKLIGQVPDCTDATLSASARRHLEDVAVKLEKDDVLAALHSLRSVQSDVYACHKADLGMAMPAVYTANVFTRAVPPGEASSANTVMIRSKEREMQWRVLEQHVAVAIDRIRRTFYHGSYGGLMQQGRFTADSALDKVIRLSGAD